MFSPRLMLYLLLLSASLSASLLAQLPVRFSGLARTQVPYLVMQSEALQPGIVADSTVFWSSPGLPLRDALDRLRQELTNLPAITSASYRVDSVAGEAVAVNWDINEARTVFPLLNIGGVKGNFFYMLGVNDIHFRGRGQNLTAFYQNIDGQHNYFLGLANPAWRNSRWGYQLISQRYAAIEPLFFPATVSYIYANLSFEAGASYTTPNRHRFRAGISKFFETYEKTGAPPESPGPESLSLGKLLFKLSHNSRQVDYIWERLSGTINETVLQRVHTIGSDDDFLIGWHDYRTYRLVGTRGNLAARLRAGVSTNVNSPFAPFVLDSQVNIRGSGNRIDRGTAQLILNLEYRHTAWRDQRDRFAIQLVAFSDLGTWRNPGGEFTDLWDESNLRHFLGGGVRLISLQAFNALLRIDYGVDVRNTVERGVVVGFGQYF